MLAYIFASKYLHIMEARRDVFQAIADPTRREIIGMVTHQSLNLNAIAEQFDVSRQAISLHIKILTECGLLVVKQQGRERYCEARLEPLREVQSWMEQYQEFLEARMDKLGSLLGELKKEAKKSTIKRKLKNK
jgi:DNA-binding transcriptional ArsR family regulator